MTLLFGDGSDGWSGLAIITGGVGTLIGLFFRNLIDYRKTADAGQLAIVQAEQAATKDRIMVIEEAAKLAKVEAAEAKKHAQDCEEAHRNGEMERSELRGQLAESKEDRARLHATLIDTAKQFGELQGQLNVLKVQVAHGSTTTNQLAERQGQLAADQGRIVEQVALLGNGGSKPMAHEG